ncbi:MAG: hypothetical protein Q9218_003118 [Villophora microphyllina]
MGQRHQLFVIAKTNGHYRLLCAIHHQWLYGHTALRRCLDVVKHFSHPDNHLPLQQELIAASKFDDDFWVAPESNEDEKNNNIPFPFIATCLIMGASFNVKGYYHHVQMEPFFMAYNEGDNNNGITVFDITDLDNVRYCFVDFYGMESERAVALMTPLSARTYLEAYYLLDDSDDRAKKTDLSALLNQFKSKGLVTTAALKETWPSGAWQGDKVFEEDDQGLSGSSACRAADEDAAQISTTAATLRKPMKPATDENKGPVKSLRAQTLDKLLEDLLRQAQDISVLDPDLYTEADVLTDFIPQLREKLYSRAATLVPSTAILHLLEKALGQDIEVDFTPFTTLSVDHLAELVLGLRNGKMRVLNLSNKHNLTEADLVKILGIQSAQTTKPEHLSSSVPPSAPGSSEELNTVVLLETPEVSIDFLTKHLGQYNIIHSELMRRPLLSPRRHRYNDSVLQPIEFIASDTVTQIVWVGISSTQAHDRSLRLSDGAFNFKENLEYSVSASDVWGSEHGKMKYKNHLLDIPLPPLKSVQGLHRLMQYLDCIVSYSMDEWHTAAARCFATTANLEDNVEFNYGVGPLSGMLLQDDDRYGKSVASAKGAPLKPGQWAIVLIHEAFDSTSQEALDKKVVSSSDAALAAAFRGEVEVGSKDKSSSHGGEDAKGTTVAAKEKDEAVFKPIKRVRYALAKSLPPNNDSEPSFLITDVPGYIHHTLSNNTGEEEPVSAKETAAKDWWREAASAFGAAGDGFFDDSKAVRDILEKVYSEAPPEETKESRRVMDPFADIMKMVLKSRLGDDTPV